MPNFVYRANSILSVYIEQKCTSQKEKLKRVQKHVYQCTQNNIPTKNPLYLMKHLFVCFYGLKIEKFSWKYGQNLPPTGASSNRRPEITKFRLYGGFFGCMCFTITQEFVILNGKV